MLNAKILHPYKAQTKDELNLPQSGGMITNVIKLNNGWCKVKLALLHNLYLHLIRAKSTPIYRGLVQWRPYK